ncbi:GTP cyclohydrolase I [Streptomyces alfalfae]|uniref:GTP cyclohydrolase I n=1 Tax=Streptomyces alfalfae TaxID=1642299 RepID=UPI0028112F6B|nr:GTP cyclohydrolase I [Streptomyces alfalfae]
MTTTPSPRAAARKFTAGLTAWLASRGLDPASPALADTPRRVLGAWAELTAGYYDDPAVHLARVFPVEHSGQPIAVIGVPFTSLCEHHMLVFTGTADIAYLPKPGAPVVGLSKLPRVLDVYAKRLQTQEQITRQVTAALDEHLESLGAACIIRSEHGCLAHRGARKPGAQMVTSSYTGVFLDDPAARTELHTLFNARA